MVQISFLFEEFTAVFDLARALDDLQRLLIWFKLE